MITLYGINNCDTVKKALKWLTANAIEYQFYDFKKQELTPETYYAKTQEQTITKTERKRGDPSS
jgi:arsenate reductase-like glutaredoxin family protein